MNNWYVRVKGDGRKNPMQGGVGAARDAGLELEVRVRSGGESVVAYRIVGFASGGGILRTEVQDRDGNMLTEMYTGR